MQAIWLLGCLQLQMCQFFYLRIGMFILLLGCEIPQGKKNWGGGGSILLGLPGRGDLWITLKRKYTLVPYKIG